MFSSLDGSARSGKERAHRLLIMNSLHRFRQQARDRQAVHLGELSLRLGAQRNRIGCDNFSDVRFVETVARRVRQYRMRRDRDHFGCARFGDDLGRFGDSSGRVDHVVDQQRDRVVHFADQLHLGHFARAPARARSTPPASGDTTETFLPSIRLRRYVSNTGIAYRLSTGILKKPWICPAWRSTVSTRFTPAVVIKSATTFALIGTRGATLR